MSEQETVLIVDDVPANVDLLEALLAKFNFNILKASSGQEALEIAKKEHPNLVLLDVMMPGLNGFQVCEKLREDQTFAAVPIIIVTAKAVEDKDIVESLEKGADDYVIKPVNGEDLSKKVKSLLAKAKNGDLPSQYYKEVKKKRADGKAEMTDYSRLLDLDKIDEEEKK